MAPTSRPHVGLSATTSLGRRESSRASTTFCWLPPESAEAARSGSGGRTSKASRSSLASALMCLHDTSRGPSPGGAASRSTRARFSARVMSGTKPRPWRSSGMMLMPQRRSRRGGALAMSSPSSRISPSQRADPVRPSISARWPLPSTPAIPSTSPERTRRLKPFTGGPDDGSGTVRPRHSRTTSGSSRPDDREISSTINWPVMALASACWSNSPRASSTCLRPRRTTDTRSAISITSPSLCVTSTMARPSARSLSMISSRTAIWRAPSRAVGSSRMRMRASR